MSATITLAKQLSTNLILHISDVDKKQHGAFICRGCEKEMIIVKSDARKKDWHFRHSEETSCTGERDTALHDYAVQLLMENTSVVVSKKLRITYNEPRKEAPIFGKRSDVTVKHESEDVHFEVFVTHDLEQGKIDMYKNSKIKCVRIDLSSHDLLSAAPETIKDVVLNQHQNKTIIYWQDEAVTAAETAPKSFGLKHVLLAGTIIIGLRYLYKLLFSNTKRRF